jgi:hypothetical protein
MQQHSEDKAKAKHTWQKQKQSTTTKQDKVRQHRNPYNTKTARPKRDQTKTTKDQDGKTTDHTKQARQTPAEGRR